MTGERKEKKTDVRLAVEQISFFKGWEMIFFSFERLKCKFASEIKPI